jgi:hypothetical protein
VCIKDLKATGFNVRLLRIRTSRSFATLKLAANNLSVISCRAWPILLGSARCFACSPRPLSFFGVSYQANQPCPAYRDNGAFAMRASNRQAMSTIKTMKELGYTCDQGIWTSSPEAVAHLAGVADAMHTLLIKRADELVGCVEGSPEEAELEAIVDAIEAYEAKRWPLGKVPGGKG